MSATWSWKSNGDTAVVRKTDDGLVPGQAVTAINNNTNSLQYITGTGGVTIDSTTIPGTTSISGGGAVQTVTNNATVLSASIASNRLTLGYSGTPLPFANGGTNVTAVPTAVSASNYQAWDVNGNTFADGYISAQANISDNTVFTAATLPGLVFCNASAQANFSIQLPDIQAGNTMAPGFETKIINVSQYAVQINTQNAPAQVTGKATGSAILLVSANILGNAQIGGVLSGTGVSGSPTITGILNAGPVTFTATCSGTTMTVSAVVYGKLGLGQIITGAGISGSPTIIGTLPASGTPFPLTYTLSSTQTFGSQTCVALGSYSLSSGQTFTNTTVTITYPSVLNILTAAPSTITTMTFVNTVNSPYWNYINDGGYNGAGSVYSWFPSTSGANQNLYLNTSTLAPSIYATQTVAAIIVAYLNNANQSHFIFLPDPATCTVSQVFTIYFILGANNTSCGVAPFDQRYYLEIGSDNLILITDSSLHLNLYAICVANSPSTGTSAFIVSSNTPIKTIAQEFFELTVSVFTIILSFADAALGALTSSVAEIGGVLPTAINVNHDAPPPYTRFPNTVNLNMFTPASPRIQRVATNSATKITNATASKIVAYAIDGVTVIGTIFPYTEVTVIYVAPPAVYKGYISGSTLTVTSKVSGGLIVGTVALPANVYGAGGTVAVNTLMTGQITPLIGGETTGGVGRYAVSVPQTVGNSGAQQNIAIDPNPASAWSISSLANLNAVSGNVVVNNIDSALRVINSDTTPTTTLDNTAAAGYAITGTTNTILILPPVATLTIGWYTTVRSSTAGTTTVQANNGSGVSIGNVIVLPPNGKCTVYLAAKNNAVADWSLNTIVGGNTVVGATFAAGINTVTASITPVTLDAKSGRGLRIIGSGFNQDVYLPDVTTIAIGTEYEIYMQATYNVALWAYPGGVNLIQSFKNGAIIKVYSVSATLNTAAGWQASLDGVASGYATPYNYGGTNNTNTPAGMYQFLGTTNTNDAYGTAVSTWQYPYQINNQLSYSPVFFMTGQTIASTYTGILGMIYFFTSFYKPGGGTTAQVTFSGALQISAYGNGTNPYYISLPFNASSNAFVNVGISRTAAGVNGSAYGLINSSSFPNNITISGTPGYGIGANDIWVFQGTFNV